MGNNATYQCKSGYKVNGPQYRRCLPDQTWSGRQPSCDSKSFYYEPIHIFVDVLDIVLYFVSSLTPTNQKILSYCLEAHDPVILTQVHIFNWLTAIKSEKPSSDYITPIQYKKRYRGDADG